MGVKGCDPAGTYGAEVAQGCDGSVHCDSVNVPSSASRLLFRIAGLLVLLAGAAGIGLYFYARGPGLDREAERLIALAGIHPGMTVAEIGAGHGDLALRTARYIGPSGHLYGNEIDGVLVDAIRTAAARAHLGNITVIQGGERSAGLPDACCEVIYMRRVYHHFTDAPAMLRSLSAALRPGGRLAIIDLQKPRWIPGGRHGIAREVLAAQVSAAGFRLAGVQGWSPIDYFLLFRKPREPEARSQKPE